MTPLSLENPQGGAEKVRVVLSGYADESVTLDLNQDSEQEIELKRVKVGRDGKRPKNPKDPKSAKDPQDPKYKHGDLTVVD